MLTGRGAIILWHDIAQDGRDQYYDWHNTEHMPERLAIPGFRRGTRWIAVDAGTTPAFLTIYELDDPGVATGAAYLARLNAPSNWTTRTMVHFRGMERALTRVMHSYAVGRGGVAATLRFVDDAAGRTALRVLGDDAAGARSLLQMPRIAAVHVCSTDVAASGKTTIESGRRPGDLAAPIGSAVVEGGDAAAVREAARALQSRLGGAGLLGVYQLEHEVMSSSG